MGMCVVHVLSVLRHEAFCVQTCDDVENILIITNLTLFNCFCLKFTNSLSRFVHLRTLLSRSMKGTRVVLV